MKTRSLKIEDFLYLFIFLIALAIRFTKLGAASLSDFEAAWAFQAFEVAQGTAATISHNPGYVLLTGLLFYLMESSETLARFLPALVGSLLIFAPYALRKELGTRPALLLAVGIALDPGFAALSRLAGGPMFALGFLVFALVAWRRGWQVAAGISAGLALLAGPDFWMGASGLLLALIVAPFLGVRWEPAEGAGDTKENRPLLISTGITLLLAGTLFLRFPAGLNAFANSFLTFLSGWGQIGDISITIYLVAFLGYLLLPLCFGIFGYVKNQGDALMRFAAIWAVIAFLLGFAYPARQVGDLLWVSLPLWILTARGVAPYFNYSRTQDWPALLLASLVFVAQVIFMMTVSRFAGQMPDENSLVFWVFILLTSILILILLPILGNLGWSNDIGAKSFVWGIGLGFLALMISSTWQVSPRTSVDQQNLWYPGTGAGNASQLELITQTQGKWVIGQPHELKIGVTFDAPILRWTFRDYPNAVFGPVTNGLELPEIILTNQESGNEIHLASAYKGQDLILRTYPGWASFTLPDWINWFVFRVAPSGYEYMIMWTRTDVFPGGADVILQDPLAQDGIDFESEADFLDEVE